MRVRRSSPLVTPRSSRRQFADYVDLTRPRIGLMVLVTVSVSLFLASWGQPNPSIALCALLGTGCVAASASVWNQWLERDVDARMPRTRRRSLPAGRVSPREACGWERCSCCWG